MAGEAAEHVAYDLVSGGLPLIHHPEPERGPLMSRGVSPLHDRIIEGDLTAVHKATPDIPGVTWTPGVNANSTGA